MNQNTSPTWTPERVEELTRLWKKGMPAPEIGRRIGVTKNAVIGKVHRIKLKPRIIKYIPKPRRNVFDFTGPICMFPFGNPTDPDFHFCGAMTIDGATYCEWHKGTVYIPKDEQEKLHRSTKRLALASH